MFGEAGGAVAVARSFPNALDCLAEVLGSYFFNRDEFAEAQVFEAGGDAGLVVGDRKRDDGKAFAEGFKCGVEAGVGDDERRAFEEGALGSVADDNGGAGEGSFELGGLVAEGEDELGVEAGAGFGDGSENGMEAILERAHRGVDERAAVEFFPGEGRVFRKVFFDPGAGVVEVRWEFFAGIIEEGRLLRDLDEAGGNFVGVLRAHRGEAMFDAVGNEVADDGDGAGVDAV